VSSEPALSSSVGPRDRESFFAAQQKNRHATWRMTALCVLTALAMGIPLTLVLTPLFYAGTLLTADVVSYFNPLPPEFWATMKELATLAVRVGDYFFNNKPLDPQLLAVGLAVLLVPGMLIALALWMAMLALFRRAGVGGAMASLNAREPSPHDLHELQLANVVQEMAIASGLPAPRVMLVDSAGANAAAIGTSPADARIVISRRLLDDLDRDQMQALLAHLIGSVGNGDLGIAFAVTSVFETCGLLGTIINAPFGPHARSTLWRVVRYAFSRGGSGTTAEADGIAALLTGDLDLQSDDIDRFFDTGSHRGPVHKFLAFVFFPIFFTNAAIKFTLWFFLTAFLGPCMALLWRSRRYLADASAVQFTRNPNALAGALRNLTEDSTAIPGGVWASHLFVVSPSQDTSAPQDKPTAEQMRLVARAWAESAPAQPARSSLTTGDYMRCCAELIATQRAAVSGDPTALARMTAFHRTISTLVPGPIAQSLPDPADLTAALRGDPAAIARLRSQQQNLGRHHQTVQKRTGFQAESMVAFHPPLKRRLQRLERMGAHVDWGAKQKWSSTKIIGTTIGFLILAPFILAAGALMLVVVAVMIMLNLLFLALWLFAIHSLFGLLAPH
jgi:Zn-dependent protease with chaperone function